MYQLQHRFFSQYCLGDGSHAGDGRDSSRQPPYDKCQVFFLIIFTTRYAHVSLYFKYLEEVGEEAKNKLNDIWDEKSNYHEKLFLREKTGRISNGRK